jgi:hypothetical protein
MKKKLPALFLTSCVLLTCSAIAQQEAKPKPPTYLTEEQAREIGPDFDLQGEYAGEQLGAQIIALGEDTFRVVLLPGGLPGAGWNLSPKIEMEAKRNGDQIEFSREGWKAVLKKGALSVQSPSGSHELKKTHRQSPTLGAKPPQGAVVLFDGSSCDAFVKGHFDELNRKLLASGSKTERADFQDFQLHVEFLLPFKPLGRGQDRGNSGVYLQDRYEVQVLDSFGLRGANNECGGLYSKKEPAVNMCFPPLSWQTYDIDFTAAKYDASGTKTQNAVVTVKHNGITIHERFEINGPTGGGKKEDPSGGAIQLQGHGNPVYYRNIWLLPR